MQYINVTLDKKLNSVIYRTLFYANIYGSYKRSKNSPVFWPTLYITAHYVSYYFNVVCVHLSH